MSDNLFPFSETSIYINVFSYLGLPLNHDFASEEVDAVVMGIPYDLGTTGRPGARSGPNAVRQASANLRCEEQRWPWTFPLGSRLKAIDYGDLHYSYGDSEDMLAKVEAKAAEITGAGKTLVSIGGDHFVTLPLLRGHARVHGKLALIHFDAHTDTYEDEEKYSHGCMFHRAPLEGLIANGLDGPIVRQRAAEPAPPAGRLDPRREGLLRPPRLREDLGEVSQSGREVGLEGVRGHLRIAVGRSGDATPLEHVLIGVGEAGNGRRSIDCQLEPLRLSWRHSRRSTRLTRPLGQQKRNCRKVPS